MSEGVFIAVTQFSLQLKGNKHPFFIFYSYPFYSCQQKIHIAKQEDLLKTLFKMD